MIDQMDGFSESIYFLLIFKWNISFLFGDKSFKKNQFSTKNARFDDCLEEKNIEFISDIFIRGYAIRGYAISVKTEKKLLEK